jgi:epoxyqueuosine reductase
MQSFWLTSSTVTCDPQVATVPPASATGVWLELHAAAASTLRLAKKTTLPPQRLFVFGIFVGMALMRDCNILEPTTPMSERSVSFSDQVRAHARALGFDVVGIARAGPDVTLEPDFSRYEAFVAAGMHGGMRWLAEHAVARSRLDGDEILAGARSVVCVGRRYPRSSGDGGDEEALTRSIARYARGHDYHRFMRRRVRRLADFVRSLGTPEQPVEARPLIDEKPVLERAWASRAGLGFVGKNGMLIVPGLGSMIMLGEVVTTLDLAVDGEPMTERCGSCTRCLDACPTQAFAAPFVLDARRCVSYLTIEHAGPVPVALREGVGDWVFGCDDCQTACPFNAGEGARAPVYAGDGEPFAPLARWASARLLDLLTADAATARALTEGSPLRRAGREKLARNAAIVLGNRRDRDALPALREAAAQHDDPHVREAAAWASDRIAE